LHSTCGIPVKSSQEFREFLVLFQPFINPEKRDTKKIFGFTRARILVFEKKILQKCMLDGFYKPTLESVFGTQKAQIFLSLLVIFL
jgi:hypothetical protein